MLSGEPHSLLRSHEMHAGDIIMHQELQKELQQNPFLITTELYKQENE